MTHWSKWPPARSTSKSDERAEVFRRATLINPRHWLAWAYLGEFHAYQAHYDEAAFDFEQSVRMSPGYARGSLGAIYGQTGRLGEAIDVLEKALEIQPGLRGAADNLGSAYFLMKGYDRAIQAYEKVVETPEATYRSYGNLAKAHYWSGDQAAARDRYQRAIEIGEERLSRRQRSRSPLVLGC